MTKEEIDEARSEIIRLTKRQIGILQCQRNKLRKRISELQEALMLNTEEIATLEAELKQIETAK